MTTMCATHFPPRHPAGQWAALLLLLVLTGCQTTPPPAPPQPYTRIHRPDEQTVQLQLAVRKFTPAHGTGPAVWLAGASHIGEAAYYAALQAELADRSVVLFEGVNRATHPRQSGNRAPSSEPRAREPRRAPTAAGLQPAMAKALGLVFQLEAIDYDRTNFFNSDLSVPEIQHLLGGAATTPARAGRAGGKAGSASAEGVAGGGASFQSLLQIMDGSSFLGGLFQLGFKLIGSSPRLQAITKLGFIETLGQLEGDLAKAPGLPPDVRQLMQVLIAERNRHVLNDLRAELRRLPRTGSVAVLYGSGHMDDFEQRLTRELGYRPAGDEWLTAFSVDLKAAGLSGVERELVHRLVQWELAQFH